MTKLVLFDLDGTLLNSIADLAHAVNYALSQQGFPTHPIDAYYKFVGNGVYKLVERALPETARDEQLILRTKDLFVYYYDLHNADYSQPYDGIVSLLHALHQQGIAFAVASNKYQSATEKLISQYFDIPFVSVLGQRDGVPCKPDPCIVADSIAKAKVQPEEVLYVGDSGVDMQTALNARVRACGVSWGFCEKSVLESYAESFKTQKLQLDIVDEPLDLLKIIEK